MNRLIKGLVASGAVWLMVASPAAKAADSERLPSEKVIAAIQAAVAAHPGEVKEVEVDERRGRLLIEVTIIGADGVKKEVQIDPATNKIAK